MKRKVALMLSICLLGLLGMLPAAYAAPDMTASSATGGLRYTISVSKFENRSGWSGQWNIGDGWGLVMTDILNQSGKFIVLGETDMRKEAMLEQDLGAAGRTAQGAITPGVGQYDTGANSCQGRNHECANDERRCRRSVHRRRVPGRVQRQCADQCHHVYGAYFYRTDPGLEERGRQIQYIRWRHRLLGERVGSRRQRL